MSFEPRLLATGIGSLPHGDVDAALDLLLATIPELPYVPQLPAASFREGMLVQYTEGLPGLVLDPVAEKFYLDTHERGPIELESFYLRVIEDDPEAFPVSPESFRCLPALAARLAGAAPLARKTQITGPVTQGLSTVDPDKRAVYYDGVFQEVLVKNCAMKARWMLRRLGPAGSTRLCFVDEPSLSAFGSSVYVSVRREDVVAQLREVCAAIRAEGGVAGVHCCGNTDWTLLTEAEVDIVSFDAHEYGHTLALYPEAMRGFVERGGIVAWGIVPTSSAVLGESVASLRARLETAMATLESIGIDPARLRRQALLTPACGLGTASLEEAETAFRLLRELSRRLRAEAGFAAPGGGR